MTLVDLPRAHARTPPLRGISMTIGRVALITGLTARAIRYYEELGLVEPERDKSRLRRYDRAARDRLTRIAIMRGCGLSLVDVETVLDSDDDDRFRALLVARREGLARQLSMVDEVLAQIRAERQSGNGAC